MAKEVNITNTLVSIATDKKLANTDNLYDKIQEMMQEDLNKVAGKLFDFKYEKIDPDNLKNAIANNSIGLSKLDDSVKSALVTTALTDKINRLESFCNGLNDELILMKSESNLSTTNRDGFFLVDANDNVGACVIPDHNNGGSIAWGWDNSHANPPTLTETSGGVKLLIRNADFSNSGLSLTSGLAVYGIRVGMKTNNGVTLELSASLTPNTTEIDASSIRWNILEGSQYLSASPTVSIVTGTNDVGDTTYTAYATYTVGNTANNSSVAITASYGGYNETWRGTVTYKGSTPQITGVEIAFDDAGNTTQPIVGKSFGMHVSKITPSGVSIKSYLWSVSKGGAYLSTTNPYTDNCTFNISDTSGTQECIIRCTVTDAENNTAQAEQQVYVQYDNTVVPTSGRLTFDSSVRDNEEDKVMELVGPQTQTTFVSYPSGSDAGTVVSEVIEGEAEIDNNGLLTLSEDAPQNSVITIRTTASNMPTTKKIDPDTQTEVEVENYFLTSVVNKCPKPLTSLEIYPGSSKLYKAKTIQLSVIPAPANVEYTKDITWSSSNIRVATVDSNGLMTIGDLVKSQSVTITATKNGITASRTYVVTYDDTEQDINIIERCVAAIGGEWAEFHAWGRRGYTRLDYENVDNLVTWSVTPIITAQETEDAISNSSVASAMPRSAQQAMMIPINNMSGDSLSVQTADLVNTYDVATTVMYPLEMIKTLTQNEGLQPSTFTEKVNVNGGGTIMKAPALRSSNTKLVSTTYSTPTFVDNKLYFTNDGVADGTVQGIAVTCNLYDSASNVGDISHLVHSKTNVYSFKYQTGKLPVTDIELVGVNEGESGYNEFITVPSNNTIRVNIPSIESGKNIKLRYFVQPIVATGHTVDDYLFDPEKVYFSHIDGVKENSLCTLSYYHSSEKGKSGAYMYLKGGADGSEYWKVAYSLEGENPWDTMNHDRMDTEEMEEYGRHLYYCPPNYITNQVTAELSHPAVQPNATAIKILCKDTYVGEVSGAPIDGGQLSTVNAANNQPVVDVNSGTKLTAIYTVISGGEYCSINPYGYDMRIYSTGGEEKDVTVKATIGNLTATATFKVYCP